MSSDINREIIEDAMWGDSDAANQCTQAGVAIPCGRCGGEADIVINDDKEFMYIICLGGCGNMTGKCKPCPPFASPVLYQWNMRVDLFKLFNDQLYKKSEWYIELIPEWYRKMTIPNLHD